MATAIADGRHSQLTWAREMGKTRLSWLRRWRIALAFQSICTVTLPQCLGCCTLAAAAAAVGRLLEAAPSNSKTLGKGYTVLLVSRLMYLHRAQPHAAFYLG